MLISYSKVFQKFWSLQTFIVDFVFFFLLKKTLRIHNLFDWERDYIFYSYMFYNEKHKVKFLY